MRTMHIGVVEDDPKACQTALDYLNRYQQDEHERFTVSAFKEAQSLLERYRPVYDILLLDIEMRGINGLDAARAIRKQDTDVVIIFITAAPQYAISGYEVQALSYLLKPVPWFAFREELRRSIEVVRRRSDDAMLVEIESQQHRIDLANVEYLESNRHTIIIHLQDGSLALPGTLKAFEQRLDGHAFFRSNSCYLVNLRHVTAVDEQDCILSNGARLRISRPRKKAFLTALTNYMSGDAR